MSDITPDVQQLPELDQFQAQIDAEQQKINEAYTQIGKTYYEGHPNDHDPAYAPYYSSIRSSNDVIKALRNQILAAKGLQACPNCGSEMPKSTRFCSECGTLIQLEADQESICKRCGEPLTEGAKFCTKCGQSVAAVPEPLFQEPEPLLEYTPQVTIPAEPDAVLTEVPVAEAPASEIPWDAPSNICPSCGESLIPGMAFCTNCGTRVTEVPTAPAAPVTEAPAFCTGCGNPLMPGSAFCTNCGQAVQI